MTNVFVIFIAAFLTRFAQVINLFPVIRGDAATYNRLGREIAYWGLFSWEMICKYPTTDHPIYPLFIGSVFSLFGVNYFALFVFQCILGSLVVILVYSVAKSIFDQKIALIAGIIAIFYPVFVKLSNTLLSEQIFVFIFLLSIRLFIQYVKTNRLVFLCLTAIALGLATLSRSVAMLFIFVLIAYLIDLKRKVAIRLTIINLVIFLFVFIATIMPQTIRNYYVSKGNIIPVTEAPSRELYVSFSPYFNKKLFGTRPSQDPVLAEAKSIKSMSERNRFYFDKTIEAIKKHPYHVIELEFWKIIYLWSPIDWEILGCGQARYNFGFVFIFPFLIYGVTRLIKEKHKLSLILFLPIFYFQFLHLIYFGLPRFRIGFEPSLVIIAAYGIYFLHYKVKQKKMYIAGLVVFLFFNFMLFIYSAETKIVIREICRKVGLW